MQTAARPHMPSCWRLVAALFLSLGLTLTLPTQGARAHSALESSTPGAGANIEAMPAQLELRFTDDVQEAGAEVVLVDEQGDSWTSGPADVDATLVTSRVKPNVPDGGYEIRWNIISIDGTPMAGVVRFALGVVVNDVRPLDVVLTAQDATRLLIGALAVLVALFAYMVYGLFTVYRPRATTAGIGQKENHHD